MTIIKKLARVLFCCVCYSCYVCLSLAQVHAEELPVAAFATLPLLKDIRLSPDGQSTAHIQNAHGKSYLVTQHGAEPAKAILNNDNDKYLFTTLFWLNNERLLLGVRYAAQRSGNDTSETRLLAINRDGSDLKANLLQSELNSFHGHRNVPQFQDSILGKVENAPDSVLLSLDLDHATLPDVYRLNVSNGEFTRVVNNPGYIHQWMADRQGTIRIGSGWVDKTIKVIVKAPGADQWQTLSSYNIDDPAQARTNQMTPLGFDNDPHFLYVSADYQGHNAIFRVDLSSTALSRELIQADPRFDVNGLLYAPWLKKVVGVQYVADYGKRIYWDQEVRKLQQQIDTALPNRSNTISNSSDDGMRHIIISGTLNEAPRIYWLDRRSGELKQLAQTRPDLPAAQMATTRAVLFKSRDQLDLHGYLTLPRQAPVAGAKYPLILFPHGGPGVRDVSSFDDWTQFFANRGWAVLQINFRGSSGYGSDFQNAGFKRWGLEMQDDLSDGVDLLIRRGVVDPARVCIVGASYGGYAAMMGIVKTPELYRCAISIAGIADLRDLLAQQQRYVNYQVAVEHQIGEWWHDREKLRQTSPAYRVKEIHTPLLLIHGKADRVVSVEQSRDMASALKSADNKDFRYVELPLGDHNLSREEDRLTTFTEMERFLKKYLDQGAAPTDAMNNSTQQQQTSDGTTKQQP